MVAVIASPVLPPVSTQVLGISVLTFQQRRRARKLLQPMMKPRQALRRGIGGCPPGPPPRVCRLAWRQHAASRRSVGPAGVLLPTPSPDWPPVLVAVVVNASHVAWALPGPGPGEAQAPPNRLPAQPAPACLSVSKPHHACLALSCLWPLTQPAHATRTHMQRCVPLLAATPIPHHPPPCLYRLLMIIRCCCCLYRHHPPRPADLFLPVFMIYMPLHTFVAASALAFVLLPARVAAAGLVGLLVPTYALTLRGYPAHTGGGGPGRAGGGGPRRCVGTGTGGGGTARVWPCRWWGKGKGALGLAAPDVACCPASHLFPRPRSLLDPAGLPPWHRLARAGRALAPPPCRLPALACLLHLVLERHRGQPGVVGR